jgi:4-hydroxy-tetrahydrodipicolinate synthase
MAGKDIRGVIVPILTPLNSDESVDTDSMRRLVNYLLDNGAHGIWVSGTTGEFANLTNKQRLISVETVVDEVAGRVPIIGNISCPSTQLSLELALAVQEMALDGIAVTPPYYYNNAQDELLDHYRYISDRSGLPLWVYNIPPTVKTIVEPSTIATLAAEGAVVGVKDSSGSGEPFAQLNVLCEQGGLNLLRFLGTVSRIATSTALGADGVIPAIANLAASASARGWEAGETGDMETVKECNAKLIAATKISTLAKGGGPNAAAFSGMKSALKHMGILDSDTVSRPLRALTEEEKKGIPAILEEVGIANGA